MPLKTNSPVFFGREQLIQQICSDIEGSNQGNVVVLSGQRRTGKTSLLYALMGRFPETFVPVLFDAEGKNTESQLYGGLAFNIFDALKLKNIDVPEPKADDFDDNDNAAYKFETKFLRSIKGKIENLRLVIMIDEFESLEEAVRERSIPKRVFKNLRNLMQHQKEILFLFCGTHRLSELTREYWDIFLNGALPRRVTFLDRDSTLALINKPVVEHFEYDTLARETILSLTGGHPLFTQLLCHYIVDLVNERKLGLVTTSIIESALGKMISSGNENLDVIWTSANALQKSILRNLSQEYAATKRFGVQTNDLMALVIKEQPDCTQDGFADALTSLENKDLLSYEGGFVAFTMDFIPLWLNRNHHH